MSHKVFQMSFASIYQALVAKVERKGGQAEDVDALISIQIAKISLVKSVVYR